MSSVGVRKVFVFVMMASSALALLVWAVFCFLLLVGTRPGGTVGIAVLWPVIFGVFAAGYYISYTALTADPAGVRWGRLPMFIAMAVGFLGVVLVVGYGAVSLLCAWFRGSVSV